MFRAGIYSGVGPCKGPCHRTPNVPTGGNLNDQLSDLQGLASSGVYRNSTLFDGPGLKLNNLTTLVSSRLSPAGAEYLEVPLYLNSLKSKWFELFKMGGDLNLKKSWHPVLMSNQRRVWEEEKKALDERKRIDQMMKERQEERQIQELQEMQEAAGGKKRLNRVDWMYSGPSSGQAGTTEEMEGYLLGKRRIDGLVKGTESKKLEKAATEESFMALQYANTVKDTTSKIREDPMLAIKKQEQAAYEAMINDPVRRRLLLKAAGQDINTKEKDRKHHKHRHHGNRDGRKHHHHRRDDRDDGRSHKRRRFEEARDREYREPRHYERRRSGSSSSSRSLSPYRRRSPSPYYHARKSSPISRRSRSPDRYRDNHYRLKPSKSWSTPLQRSSHNSNQRSRPEPEGDNRASRLAAMQEDASKLDRDREERLAALSERENRDREVDEVARAKAAKHGASGDYINGLSRKAGDMDLGERMRRGRAGYQRENDG
ncbi:MAG: hypothetical protein Q9187_003644 [Circinaria calcarea]